MNLETKDPKDMEVIIMNKPVLVIMAAGMGSRYGGLKQLDPVDNDGHIIMDFSMYDAKRAGFEKVVFIIKHEIEEEFKEHVGKRMEKYMDVAYAYQNIDNIPEGYEVPEGRVKPWGTAHAVYSCMDEIDGPFAVINADEKICHLPVVAIGGITFADIPAIMQTGVTGIALSGTVLRADNPVEEMRKILAVINQTDNY